MHFFNLITALGGAHNPHVLKCTFRFLRAVRLVLHLKKFALMKLQ